MQQPRTPRPDPFGDLTPAAVLDALDAVGWRGDGRALQLNSFENRVWLIPLETGGAVVTKFYRPLRWTDAQILEEHAFTLELAGADVPVATPQANAQGDTLFHAQLTPEAQQPWRFAVFERKPGRAPELEEPGVMSWIGRFLGRLHTVGLRQPFAERLTLDPVALSKQAMADVLSSQLLPLDAERPWASAAAQLVDQMQAVGERFGPLTQRRLHGDCHIGNVLWTESGPHFVDLDDAVNGPAAQDLWMLLAGDAATAQQQSQALLEGYESVCDFDRRELRLIEVLRSARMLHYSAWIARRWHDPAFPAAFPWFGDAAYWSEQCRQMKEQQALLAEALLSWPPAWH